jgi:hypothetical protein
VFIVCNTCQGGMDSFSGMGYGWPAHPCHGPRTCLNFFQQ